MYAAIELRQVEKDLTAQANIAGETLNLESIQIRK